MVTLSFEVAVVIVAVELFLAQYPTVPLLPPIIFPSQIKLPSEFTTVQPVEAEPPASSTSPVEMFPICTLPLDPPSRVRFEVPPADTAPTPAKDIEVAEVLIVSIDETPVKAPPDTLRPVDVNVNEPDEFPIEVFAVPVVLIFVVPATVNPAFPVINPVDVNVPALVREEPAAVRDVTPLDEITTFPVEEDPRVNVCIFVVAKLPLPVR